MSAWFPPEASGHAIGVDSAFFGIYLVAAFAVFLVVGLAMVFVMQFRRKHDDQKGAVTGGTNWLLQGVWVLAAVGLAIFTFNADFCGFLDRTVAPLEAMQIDVTARQWQWEFAYPNGHVTDTLHVAVNRPVQLNLRSDDVAHSLAIPALRINQGILPDRTTQTWFTAGVPDTFGLRSNIYSGPGYGNMRSALVSQRQDDFDAWLQAAVDIFAGRTMAEVGELLFTRHGCKACHSIDGSKLVGPSLKDVYGNTFDTREGVQIVVDDVYIRESILTPNVSVIAGFEPVMTPYEGKINDKEIDAITAWLKTLSSFAGTQQEGN